MKLPTRVSALVGLSTATLVLAACGDDGGQGTYPADDVVILVPYAAGGATDTLARNIATALSDRFDGTFVVENQPGAGGATAISSLLSGPADGTTLAVLASPTFLIPPASGQADYSLDDVRPVGLLSEQPIVLLELASSPDDFMETVTTDRKTIGTNGPDTAAGIDVNRLAQEGDLNIEQIPFGGQSELVTNLLGGNVDAIVANTTPDILDAIEAGEYRAVATFAEDRLDYLSETPTFSELGYDMASNATSQFGLFAAQDIEDEIFDQLEEGLEAELSDEGLREQIGTAYVSEEFVDGATLLETLQSTEQTYDEYFGSQE